MKPGVVITAYNEGRAGWREREGVVQYEDALSQKHAGNEVLATLEALRASGAAKAPVVLVDDGSTDGCSDDAGQFGVQLIRHAERIGIGYSRSEGVDALPPDVDVVMFLDAHMRLSDGCLDHCAGWALERDAIVWPDTRGLRDRPRKKGKPLSRANPVWTGHGAVPRCAPRKDEAGHLFRYSWISDKPVDELSRTHALISPGYCFPRSRWEDLRISKLTRGFGGNEPMLWVKAFFLDIPILHTCGAMVRHLFRAHDGHYEVTGAEVWRNMAILAKTCFDAATWDGFWWPQVFEGKLDDDAKTALASDQLAEEHLLFQSRKKRSDAEFWRGLCFEPVPEGVG